MPLLRVPTGLRAISRKLRGHRAFRRASYAQEGEDLLLLRMFENDAPGIYVDVGAHHPHRFSNTFLLYQLGWRGINIDPRPGAAAEFTRARKGDLFLELGVGEQRAQLEYHLFEEGALNTFDGELAAARVLKGWRKLGTRQLQCLPLREILAQHLPALGADGIDLLTVDVEGLDLAVLRSSDWHRYRPKVVLAEILGSDLALAQDSAVARFLADQGYALQSKLLNSALFTRRP